MNRAVADQYDVFMDWPGRLGRELPGILRHLEGARRVLDAGCGTGRHVEALLREGFDAYGADPSEDMLGRARALFGDAPTPQLEAAAPFDGILALGNVWPQVLAQAAVDQAAAGLLALLAPGGRLLLGMKAFADRLAQGDAYLPLLRREVDGRPRWFVRFVDDKEPALPDGVRVVGFHLVLLDEDEHAHHHLGRLRVWSPDELVQFFTAAGFDEVRVSGAIDDPGAPVSGEDVFLSARRPRVD
ncbi:MAG: methyltransferase domain-containing protein [Planctomycetota bacterium]|nr:methyltransferase domain-containing protein [Planctomycetota bacterium]